MPILKGVNEEQHLSYDTPGDVFRLVRYVVNPQKTTERSSKGQLIGFSPDIMHTVPSNTGEWISSMILYNHCIWEKQTGNLLRHRIISFQQDELTDPFAADILARNIVQVYSSYGHIAFYGVHMNTDNLHCHVVVDNVSYRNGKALYLADELYHFDKMIQNWTLGLKNSAVMRL